MKPALSIVVHGVSGVGKSRFGATAPRPRLIIDAEYGARFAAGRKKAWNYWTEEPPVDDGTWDTVLVTPRTWRDAEQIYAWLASGAHSFNSVVVDSITELQKRLIDQVAGTEQVTQPEWGEIWRKADDFVRRLRDLIVPDAQRPLDAVVILALSQESEGQLKPAVSGRLAKFISAHVDLTGYMYVQDNLAEGTQEHKMLITKTQAIEAKDRTDILRQTYGPVVSNPSVVEFLSVIAPLFEDLNNKEGSPV